MHDPVFDRSRAAHADSVSDLAVVVHWFRNGRHSLLAHHPFAIRSFDSAGCVVPRVEELMHGVPGKVGAIKK